jgi:hypothetical protein
MRRLIAEIFDPVTRYEYELPLPADIARALELDAKFESLGIGLVDGLVAAIAERRRVYRVLTCRLAGSLPLPWQALSEYSCAGSGAFGIIRE